MNDVNAQMEEVIRRMAAARARYGVARPGDPLPRVAVVTKTQSAERILPLLASGHRLFGENRVQEAAAKWPALKERYPEVELHLVGPLQTNKVKEAVRLFDCIETLDREKLALALRNEFDAAGKEIPLLAQVNIGEEPQKAGVSPKDTVEFVRFCVNDLHLPVRGLMCVPPVDENPAPFFALMRELGRRVGSRESGVGHAPSPTPPLMRGREAKRLALHGWENHSTPDSRLPTLSMGMSGDFELAAAMGASMVRVGSAIFGERR